MKQNNTNNLKQFKRDKATTTLVLDAAYMPSVLIELGFYQIKKKEYLDSEGQEQMALQIANSIIQYKKIYFGANAR
jgi:N-acetylmuramoyl-L-alanine amidase